GRVTRIKGQDQAIELARKTGSKLIIAGYVQNKFEDEAFFESLKGSIDLRVDLSKFDVRGHYCRSVIEPLLECDKQVIFVGQLDGEAKKQWYQHARATLFPIRWGEPFGLVAIESLACGTPVLAMKKGALPEIVTDGETGFLVDSLEGMIASLDRLPTIDRRACRCDAERRFSIARMTRDYVDVYRQVSQEHRLTYHLLSHRHPA
ncbi:MAG: glycosyltransferase, partial [Nitrospinota bacterium]